MILTRSRTVEELIGAGHVSPDDKVTSCDRRPPGLKTARTHANSIGREETTAKKKRPNQNPEAPPGTNLSIPLQFNREISEEKAKYNAG
jgi:hypothetical protein